MGVGMGRKQCLGALLIFAENGDRLQLRRDPSDPWGCRKNGDTLIFAEKGTGLHLRRILRIPWLHTT
jgi:hypothetical protein